VVEQLDAEELAGAGQAPRQRDVFGRGFGSARVRVPPRSPALPGEDGGLEYFREDE
jgi:hypothetical protein